METTKKSLTEIVKGHKLSVLDTSALDASRASEHLYRSYREELDNVLRDHKKKVYTIEEVIQESSSGVAPEHLAELPLKIYKKPDIDGPYLLLQKFLLPLAREKGIIKGKKYPLADVKLAAFALSLAHIRRSVAFLSSDMKLNSLIYDVHEGIKTKGYPRGFPCIVQGRVDVYSFIQRTGKFVPFYYQ